ncbi:MAG: NAD(P)H-hydrate dehydratase [Alphaproteobacteria bacterium]|nr:NAD(P)H-hydrate dehydratase [Alphaproteobacteria bacterium]
MRDRKRGIMTSSVLPDWRAAMPWPGVETHKHLRGRLGVVSGKATQTGAARLAARAGLRIGAGLVRILCPPDAAAVIAPAVEAIMVTPFGSEDALAEAAENLDAVVIGPAAGISDATRAHVRALAGTGAALVVDADGLTVFEGWPEDLFEVLDRDDVLTPHEGEFRRLFPDLPDLGREAVAAAAAARAGAVVVLKGPATVIAAPDGRIAVNDNGVAWLATAGSGDVLAGMIAGLMAQRMDSFDAARAAVWIHAEAARGFGPGLIADDLPDRIPAVLAALYSQAG